MSGSPERCGYQFSDLNVTSVVIAQFLAVTVTVTAGFICVKTAADSIRRQTARLSVIVIGAGPIGLTSGLIAARSGKVSNLTLFEERSRYSIVNNSNQVAFDMRSRSLLAKHGIDINNLEGCYHKGFFFTRSGVYQEYVLTILNQMEIPVHIRLNHKFPREGFKNLRLPNGRSLVIVCDGRNGMAASILGLSDIFVEHPCAAYGAVASLDRPDQLNIPAPEKRVHGLTFDMTAYGIDTVEPNGQQGFHFKIFGSPRRRCMVLAIPKCENRLVKALRLILDRSMMRNIFRKCFNVYKSKEESELSDSVSLKCMRFSPRLFEIKLLQREETVAYYEDCDMFVLAEGDSARRFSFYMGMDVNLGLRGLESLKTFINMAASSQTEHSILRTMRFKSKHAEQVCKDIRKSSLKEYLFT